MIKKFLKPIVTFPFGKRGTQWFFEQLKIAAFRGLNLGCGGKVEESGEEYVLQYVKKRSAKHQLKLFDVGSNIGDWSQRALECFGDEKIQVYAFEPSKITFDKLVEKFGKNHNFHLFNIALGEENSEGTLYSNAPASGIASIYQRRLDHLGIAMDSVEKIQMRTLDDFCREHNITKIDFLKMDVEGHELQVLKGAVNLITSSSIRFIQFEFGGCNIDSRTYFQDFFYLLNKKYRIYRILKNGLHPILKYRETDECFVTTNYFAEFRS